MASTYHCVVATPTQKLFGGDIHFASVPGGDGSFGVLPGHELLMALNAKFGVAKLDLDESGSQKEEFLISEGATQMFNGMLTILGRFGKNVKDINVDEVQKSAQEMKTRIDELKSIAEITPQQEVELESCQDRLEWYEMQLDYIGKN